jgi:mono/diheme cytochrome c family protein
MKKTLLTVAAVLVALAAVGAVIIGAGLYNVAADEPHGSLVFRVLETARARSIAVRADDIEAPQLDDPAMVRRGAGNYDAMCVGCHLAPGKAESELSAGLYPAPPDLTEHAHIKPAEVFWVIKHGIKATGMPAWGKSMEDRHIWDLVALVRKLPSLSAEQYAAEVEASEGHSHGGGESGGHTHEEGAEHDEGSTDDHSHAAEEGDQPAAGHDHSAPKSPAGTTHVHADGAKHVH